MSHTSTKKSVFDRIGGGSSSSGTTNVSNKSTHGFCTAYVKTGTCPLGETCKYIHEQPIVDKQSGSKEDMRITKTITRVVDMSSSSIKSTVTVSNEQRPVIVSNSIQSTRTVVESVNTNPTEHSDRRLSGSDPKQSQNRNSDSKSKSLSKKKPQTSSYENRHSSTRKSHSDSPVSSASDSEYAHSSNKHKRKSNSHSKSSKYKKRESISPNYHHHDDNDNEETLNDQLIRQNQTYNKSPKRTIVITKIKKDENIKQINKNSKIKTNPDIEFLGSKKINRDKKSIETIHQQTENPKKILEIKREKKSPIKSLSSSDQQQRHHSSSTNTTDINLSIKTEHQSNKTQNSSERSDRITPQLTPPIVQLSPTLELIEKGSIIISNEIEKSTTIQPPSPICVILDDDSSPAPSIEKKIIQQTFEKKSNENEKLNSKQNKRSRDLDKNSTKEKSNEHTETKRKRLNDGSSSKTSSNSKSGNDNRSTSNRSDIRHSTNTSSRDDSSNRKYKDKSESKTSSRNNDLKDRSSTILSSSSSKSRNNNDRRDTTRSSSEKKRSTHRHGKEKGLENVTDSEEHLDESILPKQTVLEAYMSMDWSSLSRDKRIPLNTQITSRIVHHNDSISICERLLTSEQKEQLNGLECQAYPLTNFIKQLENKTTSSIVQSCHRRFGSCAKDMIDMRHKWFIQSVEPVQQYEFINKEHYMAYQQAINSLLDKTSVDIPTVQIETTTADVLLS